MRRFAQALLLRLGWWRIAIILAMIPVSIFYYLREQSEAKYWNCLNEHNPYHEDLIGWDPKDGTMAEWMKTEVGMRYEKHNKIAEQKCLDVEPSHFKD